MGGARSVLLVVDTNVLVSGVLRADGPPAAVLAAVLQGDETAVVSRDILAEYAEVLSRRKFGFDARRIQALLDGLRGDALFIAPSASRLRARDPGDQRFVDAAVAAFCPIVTGNVRDFPRSPDLSVLTPAEWLRRSRSRATRAGE